MEDQIIHKLSRVLERQVTSEPLVVYLLVEIRKLMDRKGLQYDSLRLCCNWVVHVELSEVQAAQQEPKKVEKQAEDGGVA